ncbi:MAG: hypothetical protein ABIH83_04020 [Candidatus Micrarchaeota archaeon]
MGKIITLAKYGKQGMTDIEGVNAANAKRVQIHSLCEFNHRLLETNTWKSEKDIYPAYSSKWIILEAKDKKIGKSGIIERIYDIDGIKRVADLNALGLSQYIGEKNIAFFVDQNPDIGNRKPNLEIIKDGNNAIVVVNDLNTIVAIENMPRHGEQISAYNYERLIGVAQTDDTYLNFYLSDDTNNRLLTRGCVGCIFYVGHLVDGDYRPDRFGVQGKLTEAPASASAQTVAFPQDLKALRAGAEKAL